MRKLGIVLSLFGLFALATLVDSHNPASVNQALANHDGTCHPPQCVVTHAPDLVLLRVETECWEPVWDPGAQVWVYEAFARYHAYNKSQTGIAANSFTDTARGVIPTTPPGGGGTFSSWDNDDLDANEVYVNISDPGAEFYALQELSLDEILIKVNVDRWNDIDELNETNNEVSVACNSAWQHPDYVYYGLFFLYVGE